MSEYSYLYRVYFLEGAPPRNVVARSEETAKACAFIVERIAHNRNPRLRTLRAERLFAVGRHIGNPTAAHAFLY